MNNPWGISNNKSYQLFHYKWTSSRSRTFLRKDFFHSTYDAACQANLNPMRMYRKFCKNILNDSFRQFAGTLILFLDNLDKNPRINIRPVSSTHLWPLLVYSIHFQSPALNPTAPSPPPGLPSAARPASGAAWHRYHRRRRRSPPAG